MHRSSPLRLALIAVAAALILNGPAVRAETATGSLAVGATVAASCVISTTDGVASADCAQGVAPASQDTRVDTGSGSISVTLTY